MGDDAFTLVIGQQNLPSLLELSKTEPHPPLFYVVLHFWQFAAGRSEFAGRFLGLWFGVAGLAAIYRLGLEVTHPAKRRNGLSWLAVAAAALAATNPFLIGFGQQVRMYTLVVFLAIVSCYLLLRIARWPARQPWVAYFATSLLAVYSHFFGFFVLLAQAVFVGILVFGSGRRWLLWPWLKSQIAIVLCYLPWVIVAYQTLMSYTNGLVRKASLGEIVRVLPPTFLSGSPTADTAEWVAGVAAVLLSLAFVVGFAAWMTKPRTSTAAANPEVVIDVAATSPDGGLLVLCYLLAPILAVYAISLVRPMFFERYMVVIMPAFLLALAAGVALLAQRRLWPLALAAIAALAMPAWTLLPSYYSQVLYATGSDVQDMLNFMRQSGRPDAAFIVNLPPSDPMYRYYKPAGAEYFIPNPGAGQQAATDAQLKEALAAHSEVWLTPWDYDHTAYVEGWLDAHAFRVDQHWFANAEVIRYESPLPPSAAAPSSATFVAPDARIDLRSIQVYSTSTRAGTPILFSLFWQSTGPTQERYKVFTHLLDSQNHVVTQRDDEPVANKRPTTSWQAGETISDNYALVVPAGTPPGQYQIEIGLYRLTDGVRLHLTNGDDRVVLATVTVSG